MKESFIFYRSFYEALREMPKEDRVELYDAICELALNGNEVELQGGIQKAIFSLIKPQISANNRKYENGCKTKRKKSKEDDSMLYQHGSDLEATSNQLRSKSEANPKQKRSETEAKQKQDASETEANVNVNDNVNENVNDKEKGKEKDPSSSDDTCLQAEKDERSEKIPYDGIIAYLNSKTGSDFKSDTKATRARIKARWNEGFKASDFKRVIDVKCEQWLTNDEMVGYLRPDTLFGTKFEAYLQESRKPKKTSLPDWYESTESAPPDPDMLARALDAQKRAGERR